MLAAGSSGRKVNSPPLLLHPQCGQFDDFHFLLQVTSFILEPAVRLSRPALGRSQSFDCTLARIDRTAVPSKRLFYRLSAAFLSIPQTESASHSGHSPVAR